MPDPLQRPPIPWKLAVPLALALGLGALLSRYLGHPATLGISIVALCEILMLLSRIARLSSAHMAAHLPHDLRHERLIKRSRRLATRLRDLRGTVSVLPDAVVVLDTEQQIRWFNRSAERLLGLRRTQHKGIRLSAHLQGTGLEHWWQLGAPEPLQDVQAPGHPDSHLSVSLLPFGQRQHVLLARDISHLSRLEQVRRDFVANVSHELRTPLTVIHGYLELLDPDDVPELAQVIHEMRLQSRRMGQIVEDLLTLSRLETQDSQEEERVHMRPLLTTLHREAEALSQGRHRITLEATAEMDLLGSLKDLHSAFSNLVSNAVRYTPTHGHITIRWQRTQRDGAIYSVTDTGYGIPANHIARLTERFYRVSSSRSRETGGTGLGLSIVKHVLMLHQARLSIDSTPGQGSTFACHFGAERLL